MDPESGSYVHSYGVPQSPLCSMVFGVIVTDMFLSHVIGSIMPVITTDSERLSFLRKGLIDSLHTHLTLYLHDTPC